MSDPSRHHCVTRVTAPPSAVRCDLMMPGFSSCGYPPGIYMGQFIREMRSLFYLFCYKGGLTSKLLCLEIIFQVWKEETSISVYFSFLYQVSILLQWRVCGERLLSADVGESLWDRSSLAMAIHPQTHYDMWPWVQGTYARYIQLSSSCHLSL